LRDGSLDRVHVEFSENDRWLTLYRQSIAIVCNLSGQRLSITLRNRGEPMQASDPNIAITGNVVEVPGESVLIVEQTATRIVS
jgi:hypothetical protein